MLLVGIGGALGSLTRFWLGTWISKRTTTSFPLSTWLINITGSFLLGALASSHLNQQLPESVWLFSGVGFLGAYTTFSTFGVETLHFLRNQLVWHAAFYVVSSVLLGIGAVYAGSLLF